MPVYTRNNQITEYERKSFCSGQKREGSHVKEPVELNTDLGIAEFSVDISKTVEELEQKSTSKRIKLNTNNDSV